MIEFYAAKVSDLPERTMKMASHQGNDILLTRIEGKIHAVSGHCCHYGAPLDEGVLVGNRVICPWHQAVFNAQTGDLLDPPSLDSLTSYEVKIQGDDVIVLLPEKIEACRRPVSAKYKPEVDDRTFVILGAGAAGYAAAQTLREEGFQGRLIMITQENRPAYDRPMLSKAYLQGNLEKESLKLRPDKFYQDHDLELRTGKAVTSVDTNGKSVKLEGGETLRYDKLLIATGGLPRRLETPGADLPGVFVLRSVDDCDAIIAALNSAKQAAVVGSSFIGLETAFSLIRRKKMPVTVIAPETVPFEKVFGREIGQLARSLHEKNGVSFKLGRSVKKIEGSGKVEAVILDNGERVEADLVIVGIGVRPATDFLHDIPKEPDGSLKVDRFLRVKKDVWAAGDVARYPDPRTGRDQRIEHWRTALQQGRCVGRNMAGKDTPYDGVPFFWTSQAGLGLRYVGHAQDWDETIIQGDMVSLKFIVFYMKNGQVLAAAGNKQDKVMNAIHELMYFGRMPSGSELRAHPEMDWVGLARQVTAPSPPRP